MTICSLRTERKLELIIPVIFLVVTVIFLEVVVLSSCLSFHCSYNLEFECESTTSRLANSFIFGILFCETTSSHYYSGAYVYENRVCPGLTRLQLLCFAGATRTTCARAVQVALKSNYNAVCCRKQGRMGDNLSNKQLS